MAAAGTVPQVDYVDVGGLIGMIERQSEFRETWHQPFGVMTKILLGSS